MTLPRETKRKPCARCGVGVTLGGRTGAVVICTDCRDSDPAYTSILLDA